MRQKGEGGQPGREVAKLSMDATGALRAEPGGHGAVLGQMDPSGNITLTPAGEAYLAERDKGAQTTPAPGGKYDPMGNWTGPGDPEPVPQPAAPGPVDAAPPRPGTPGVPQKVPGQEAPMPDDRPAASPADMPAAPGPGDAAPVSPPLVAPDIGVDYDPRDPEEAELVAKMHGRSGTEIQNAINELRTRRRGVGGSGVRSQDNTSGSNPVVPTRPPPARPAAQPTPRDGVIGGKPVGEPEVDPHANRDKQEALQFQARSEDAMAGAGYRVERGPVVRPEERLTGQEEDKLAPNEVDLQGRIGPEKKPDDRIGGNLADMVAPRTSKLEGVRDALSDKIKDRQAYRLVLNLGRTSLTREQVDALLQRKPIQGLQELFIIEKDGAIFRAFPDPEQVTPAPQAR